MRRVRLTSVAGCVRGRGLGVGALGAGRRRLRPAARARRRPAGRGAAGRAGQGGLHVADERLVELSGLVATDERLHRRSTTAASSDSRSGSSSSTEVRVVKSTVAVPAAGPARPGGSGAVARTARRSGSPTSATTTTDAARRVALWKMPADGVASSRCIHRLRYPDGKPRDAEALLIGGDGMPIIITKGAARPSSTGRRAPLRKTTRPTVPLEKVGELTLPKTATQQPARAARPASRSPARRRRPTASRSSCAPTRTRSSGTSPDGDIVKALTVGHAADHPAARRAARRGDHLQPRTAKRSSPSPTTGQLDEDPKLDDPELHPGQGGPRRRPGRRRPAKADAPVVARQADPATTSRT